MISEQLRGERIAEAARRYASDKRSVLDHLCDLYETNWIPPVVDPDLLAAREWAATRWPFESRAYRAGHQDDGITIPAYLAGCTRGREGAKGLVAAAEGLAYVLEATWPNLANTEPVRALRAALASAKRGG